MNEIDTAAILLRDDKLVAIPTETVYGLAGNALSDKAVAAIYSAKQRPQFNPLIVHVLSIEHAREHAQIDARAELLAKTFWPGPLTLVLPRKKTSKLSLLLSAGLDSVAVRSPAHPLAREVLEKLDFPLAAPSANRSGRVSPTEAAHVASELGDRVAMILDGGACQVGLESTVLDLTTNDASILRHGAITVDMLEPLIGSLRAASSTIKAPGMLASHYAPSKPLRMNALSVAANDALLAFGKPVAGAAVMQNLSESENLEEAAANLFRMIRLLDNSGAKAIAVMPIPEKGLGLAINDRLRRAAHGTDYNAQEVIS
ncbi:MAG: threonylcarbamoyl-AMP synthase [Rickettsiales bacterium]|jgi:L-threonylcarbamoyladenylate synthase|nr:threonylcarbamoyl-AMP synthase [Rickettsiales bacterium]